MQNPGPERYDADVIVIGGGTGGVPAAIAAARNSASVLLVEKNGFLGGLTTGGLMRPWPHRLTNAMRDFHEPYVEGIYTEVLERAQEVGGLQADGRTWEAEVLKLVLEDMCLEAGVKLLYHSFLFRVETDGRRIRSIEVANKSGARTIRGKVYVDGTGDGDLIAMAGGAYEKGRSSDGASQPMSMTFRLGNVDVSKLPSSSPSNYNSVNFMTQLPDRPDGEMRINAAPPRTMPEDVASLHREYLEAQKRGEITNPRGDLMFWVHAPGIVHFNTTRIQRLDATNAEELTRAEIEGKRQVLETIKFLRKYPAFKDSYLVAMSSEIGIRESRRIVGEYMLTQEDVLNGRKFGDGVSRAAAPVDIHGPTGPEMTLVHPPDFVSYDIPYRCLVPADLDNALVGSRCISATHEAHASSRMVPQVYAIGQAAGTAAALASRREAPCKELDTELLRRTLIDQGASIWQDGIPG